MLSKGSRRSPRRFFLSPRFQGRMILASVFAALGVICVFYFSVSYLFWSFEVQGQAIGLEVDHPYFQFVAEQKNTMNLIFAVVTAVVVAGLGLFGMVMSHRVAGPVHRVSRHLQTMAETHQFHEMQFRTADEFPELAGAVNSLVKSLNEPPSSPGPS